MNGGWSSWSAWAQCTYVSSNSDSVDYCLCSHRKCDNPSPRNGGTDCEGVITQVRRVELSVVIVVLLKQKFYVILIYRILTNFGSIEFGMIAGRISNGIRFQRHRRQLLHQNDFIRGFRLH